MVGARLRLLDPRDVLGAADDDVVGEPLGQPRGRRRSRPSRSCARRAGAPPPAPRSRSPTCRSSRAPAARRRGRPCAITWRANIASGPMSLASAVRIAVSSVRSIAGRGGPPPSGAWKSATASIASVAEPPLPSASSRPPAANAARSSAAAAASASALVGQRLHAQRGGLGRLREHGRADVGDDRLEVVLLLGRGTDTGTRTRRCRGPSPRGGPRAGRGARRTRARAPTARGRRSRSAPGARTGRPAGRARSRRQPRSSASAAAAAVSGSSRSNAISMSSGSATSATCAGSGPPSAVSASAGSARLPTITGWTNSTATWRASERAAGVRPSAMQPPAAGEALRERGGRAARAGRPRRRTSARRPRRGRAPARRDG